MKTVYLDNNATTMVAPEVYEDMAPLFCELYGEVVFTSGGTESDNAAIAGTLAAYPHKRKVITSRVEHSAVLAVCRELENQGYNVVELGVDRSGNLDLDELENQLDDNTALVSIMYANNETGVIFPIEQIAEIVTSKGSVFHTDAVQAVGKIPLNLSKSKIDLLSLSGHKLHGPKGIGALYIKKGTRISPFIVGGHQEAGKRAGTENTPAIVGLGKACELAAENIEKENTKVKSLRDRLEAAILEKCPASMLNGDKDNRLPNTTNISFEYIEGESILLMLDKFGICASSGSACTSGSLEPSHVLRAMGVPFTAAHGSIRFSLSRYTTDEEIDFVIEKLPPIIARLRELSPFVS